jgi:hypothetical protein
MGARQKGGRKSRWETQARNGSNASAAGTSPPHALPFLQKSHREPTGLLLDGTEFKNEEEMEMHLASADLPPIMARACCRPMIKAMGQDSSSSMWKNGGAFFDVEMKGMRGLKSRGNQCGWEEQRRLCRVKHSASARSLTLFPQRDTQWGPKCHHHLNGKVLHQPSCAPLMKQKLGRGTRSA